MKKFIIFICSLAIILSSLIVPVSAQNYAGELQKSEKESEKLHCKVDYMINMDDGAVIFDRNSTAEVAPASLTKIMTALVVLRNIKDLNQTITVSPAAIESLYGTGSSLSGLKEGEQMSAYDMLCCLLIPSGNDAAVAFAMAVGGSIEAFVEMMNNTAKEIGCEKTHFDNPHGLDSPTHKTTARDLVKITREALKYPAFETIVASQTYNLPATNKNQERQLVNTNYLIIPHRVTYYNKYCKGIKTGSTDNAGKCLVSYASKDGYTYLAVAMGGDQIDTDNDKVPENQAFMDSNRMYNWAFKNLKYEVVTQEGQFVCSAKANYSWAGDSIRLVSEKEVISLVPQGNNDESVSFEPVDVPKELDAPIKKGEKIGGYARVMFAGQQIGTASLVAADDMKFSVILYVGAKLKAMTKTKAFAAAIIIIILCVAAYCFMFYRTNQKRKKKRQIKIVKYNELHQDAKNKKK